MVFSPIQNDIISRLKNADVLRYKDMHPADVPNDLYNYHLQQLLRKDIVTKVDQGYRLSASGLRHVADVHHSNDQSNRLFKINVITIVSRVIDGELMILNQVRLSNPSYGKVGVMGGTIVKGELLPAGAKRKLEQETEVIADFKIIGSERRLLYKDNELFSDVLFPIAYASVSHGEPVDTEFGLNKWVPIDEAIDNDSANPKDSIQSITLVLKAIKDGTIEKLPYFFHEVEQYG